MESLLLNAFLAFLILVVLVVVFVPIWLERSAKRNRALRLQYAAELEALERDARKLERAITPYARGHSAHFHTAAVAARERVAALDARLAPIGETLDEMRCPQVFDYSLPVFHFLLAPGDGGAILADNRRVGRLRRDLRAATAAATEATAAVEGLAALPDQLAAERAAVAARLDALEGALRAERAAGIEALTGLETDAARLRRLLAEAAAVGPDGALPALDESAGRLEAAEAGATELEPRLAALAEGRARLDERLDRALAELDDAQVAGKAAGPAAADAPPQVAPLLRRAGALLRESAPAHRRRADFLAAAADVTAATRLIAMGRDLTEAARLLRRLTDRDDGASLTAPIGQLRRDLAQLLDAAGDAPPSAAREAALAARAAEARRRAETLAAQQDEQLAALAREATALRERLARAWEASQRQLRLANDDPLARRHARLLADFDAAQRRPDALAEFRAGVDEFEGVLAPWMTRVEAARHLVVRQRERLPHLIDEAIDAAAPWQCLADHVAFIQQRAADFETAQARFAAIHRRREAEALLDELEGIERDVTERFALLTDQAARLRFLETDVDQIVALAVSDVDGLPPEHPERIKRERALNLIGHHTAQAHAAARYEDASLALSRAADQANRLAL